MSEATLQAALTRALSGRDATEVGRELGMKEPRI